jgi:hypothetical protein
MQTISYPSKIDAWLGGLLILLALLSAASLGAASVLSRSAPTEALVWAISGACVAAILGLLAWPVRYELRERALVVRFGVFHSHVPFQDILSVRPSHNPLSAPALSLDRLHVETRGGMLLISPSRREEFLRDLAARAGLASEGERLVRKAA